MYTGVQAISRVAVLLAVAVLASAAIACGDDGDSPSEAAETTGKSRSDTGNAPAAARRERTEDESRNGRATADSSDGPAPGTSTESDGSAPAGGGDLDSSDPSSEEEAVASVVSGMYADIARGDAAGVCAVMTKSVRAEIAQNVLGGSTEPRGNRTCEESFSKFLDAAAGSGVLEQTLNADVEGVRVDGTEATATVSISGRTGEVNLVKEDGEWRFGAAPVGGSR